MRGGASGALMNSEIDDGDRPRKVATLLLGGLAVVAGLVVVGGGIVLFLTALFG